jgi:TIR domain/Endonuclease/Exonuclease/phosphatase family
MADVFLSYAHADRLPAQDLCDHLTGLGRSVFLDRRRLQPGSKWEPHLMAELESARCVLVLWSNASLRSNWVRKEATSGYMRRRLVQALLTSVEPPEPFGSFQAVDLNGWHGEASPELGMLTDAIDEIVRLPPGAPRLVADEVYELVQRLDNVAPEKQLGENLLLATWNVRSLGRVTERWTSRRTDVPKRDRRSLVAIAEIMRRFDLIVLQEVKDPLEAFKFVLSVLGDEWAALVLNPTKGLSGNEERTAFVFDTRRLMPHGLIDRLDLPEMGSTHLFFDSPYAAFFRTRLGTPLTFGLVTFRVLFGKRVSNEDTRKLKRIALWLRDWAEELRATGGSLLLLGDLGVDRSGDPLYDALVQTGIVAPNELQRLPRTIFGADEGGASFVDHIGWMMDETGSPIMSLRYRGRAGLFDFAGVVHRKDSKAQLSWRISDHYPLWIELATRATRG